MKTFLIIIGSVGLFLLGAVQLYAGWLGIAHTFGQLWSFAALLGLFFLRLLLPFTVGAFFCARDLWEWHWTMALIFASPGLVFSLPGVISMLSSFFRRLAKY